VRILAQRPAPGADSIVADGGRVELSLPAGPLRLRWTAEHRGCVPGERFQDVQVRGPFRSWEHTHAFAAAAGGCTLSDRIDYRHGVLTGFAGGRIRRDLARLFAFRHARTRDDLARHAAWSAVPRLRIAVAGASGLVGSALVPFLTTGGHQVLVLSRRGGDGRIAWDPAAGRLDAAALEGVDAVIHLAGEPVARRWSAARKRAILASRVDSTRLLATTLAGLRRPPRALVVASGVGWYGPHDDDGARDESAPAGGDFLAGVCRAWEAAADPARAAGIRTVHARIGLVLSARGGALGAMLPAFRLGAGGPVGGGRQWQSWIQLDDLVDVLHRAVMDPALAGPLNAVAPAAVRQREFAATLGRVLRRPAWAPLPGFAVSLLFGEMGRDLLLGGIRVAPQRLAAAGFAWRFTDLEAALRFELGR
jgi:uncharacterized protein (TIGR01777 family)